MYGKFFASTFTGSMFGAGVDVFAVWGWIIANAVKSTIEVNPLLVGAVLGVSPDRVRTAIEFLCAGDQQSRTQTDDGRRLIHEGAFQYRVVNHSHYRAIQNEDERRAYNREAQQRSRAKRKGVKKEGSKDLAWADDVLANASKKEFGEYVYLVAYNDHLKIGMSSNPWARFKELKCSMPGDAVLISVCKGDLKLEQALHAKFAELRTEGEWFEDTQEIRSWFPASAKQPTGTIRYQPNADLSLTVNDSQTPSAHTESEAVSSKQKQEAKSKKRKKKRASSESQSPTKGKSQPSDLAPTALSLSPTKVFDFWNLQDGLTQHRALTAKMKASIRARLKNYTVDEICRAISKYAELCRLGTAPGYSEWGLHELMSRSEGEWIDKHLKSGYEGIRQQVPYNSNAARKKRSDDALLQVMQETLEEDERGRQKDDRSDS